MPKEELVMKLRHPYSPNVLSVNMVTDDEGRPAGGTIDGPGLHIEFQQQPAGDGGPEGAHVEDLLVAAHERLAWYTGRGYGCDENDEAIRLVAQAPAAHRAAPGGGG